MEEELNKEKAAITSDNYEDTENEWLDFVYKNFGIKDNEVRELMIEIKRLEVEAQYSRSIKTDLWLLKEYFKDLSPRNKLKIFIYRMITAEWEKIV